MPDRSQDVLAMLAVFGLLFILACSNGEDEVAAPAPLALENTAPLTADVWQPAPGISWQWQIDTGDVDRSFDVAVYDIDLFDVSADLVSRLQADGRHVICYMSAGSWEEWRPDADAFPAEVLGDDYDGWEGERWLDIRNLEALAPIMGARLDLCAAKGFDGIEPDNIDGYTNDTGFPLTYNDQLRFNRWLANEAHQRGLSIGLKNDSDQVDDLIAYFDWGLTEDCLAEGWCEDMEPFLADGKAVFAAEYTDMGVSLEEVCSDAEALGLSVILKDRELTAERQACGG